MEADARLPLTFDEHRDLSRELKETHLRMTELHNLVIGLYGGDHDATRAFAAAADALGRLRDRMQDQALEDCPGRHAGELYR